MKLKRRTILLVFFVTVLLTGFYSCSVKQYIPSGRHLVGKSKIQFTNKKQRPLPDVGAIRQYIQPRPNKKFLFTRINLWAYFKNKEHPTAFNKWLNKRMGEKPVYFIDEDLNVNARRIKSYLYDVGYFHAKVKYKVHEKGLSKEVSYIITPGKPYRYNKVRYDVEDTTLVRYLKKLPAKKMLEKGKLYNAFKMDDDRNKISNLLRGEGYYFFNRNYVQYVVDTNLRDHKVNVQVVVKALEVPNVDHPGKFIKKPHVRYMIKNVSIIPNYQYTGFNQYDTLNHIIHFRGDTTDFVYHFLMTPKMRFKLNAFDNSIKIRPDRHYSDKSVQDTYNYLFRYRVLRSVNISFDTLDVHQSGTHPVGYLNTRITMQTNKLNTFSVEGMGTNSSGNLGVNGGVSFTNQNIFKGGEVFSLRFTGGFEAQKQIAISDSTSSFNNKSFFNTFETGINASINFPMVLFPFRGIHLLGNSQTSINLGYNYQLRPYYSRSITNVDLGYSWDQDATHRHILTPININFVKVNPSPEFAAILSQETNLRLKEQYSNHMILGLKYSFIYNQQQQGIGSFNYLRLDFESSGNLLYGMNHLLGSKRSSGNYYTLLGVRYSQYARLSADYRNYIHFDNDGRVLVFRTYIGLAIPYGNSAEIPYEKGFYAGGANGMRGWHFRMLGPGGYSGNDVYERIGDIQLETNLELRFPIYHFFKGALFADMGNIWNYNASPTYPNGQFKWNSFARQLALDTGFGFRLDFNYFVFRFDIAAPVINPAYPQGSRWRLPYLKWNDFIGNFGIGYPF